MCIKPEECLAVIRNSMCDQGACVCQRDHVKLGTDCEKLKSEYFFLLKIIPINFVQKNNFLIGQWLTFSVIFMFADIFEQCTIDDECFGSLTVCSANSCNCPNGAIFQNGDCHPLEDGNLFHLIILFLIFLILVFISIIVYIILREKNNEKKKK